LARDRRRGNTNRCRASAFTWHVAYEAEDVELHEDAKALAEARTMRTHSVVVLVDNLDAAAARAIQYARTLQPDQLRAVHFDLDPWRTSLLVKA
jgi:hypothetical protein